MKTRMISGNGTQAEITLTLPGEVLGDLEKTASINKTKLGDLVYSYIIDGLAGDAFAVRQVQSTGNVDGVSRKKNIFPGSVEDLLKNLVY